jgi:hypothetical protein
MIGPCGGHLIDSNFKVQVFLIIMDESEYWKQKL